MKKIYQTPKAEFIVLDVEDVITDTVNPSMGVVPNPFNSGSEQYTF